MEPQIHITKFFEMLLKSKLSYDFALVLQVLKI